MSAPPPTIALIDWSHLLEDFLDNIGVSFAAFRDEMTGGWLFGYIDALQLAGCRVVLYTFSARVRTPLRERHGPTGATICVLPAPRAYRLIRRRVLNPYAPSVAEAVGLVAGWQRPLVAGLREIAPYLATPPWLLARELRRDGCTALICQEYEHARFDLCVLLGALLRLPVYATFQGGDWQLSRLERPLRPLTLRRSAGLIVASSSEAARLRRRYRLPQRQIAAIFNPLDLALWTDEDRVAARGALDLPPAAQVVAWHGRINLHRKGLDLLLAAWEQLTRARPERDLRLLLLGDGSDAPALRARLDAANLHGVRWLDRYTNDRAAIRRLLYAADVYAFPSRHEGFPVAPIEALACGLPLVATDAPGVPDMLGYPPRGGLLVAREDVAGLAAALGRVLDDPALRQRLSDEARRRACDCFSLEAVGAALRRLVVPNAGAQP